VRQSLATESKLSCEKLFFPKTAPRVRACSRHASSIDHGCPVYPVNLPGEKKPYVQLLRELGGERFLKQNIGKDTGLEFFERNFGLAHLNKVIDRRPAALAVWLTFTRMANSAGVTDSLGRLVVDFLHRHGRAGIGIALLPISALSDLRWLAAQTKIPELQAAVFELTGNA
jgi:hypothetical protein